MAGQVTSTTTERRDRLVPALAVVGAGFLAFQLWGYVSWALDGGSTPFETSATIPDSASSAIRLGLIVTPTIAVLWLAFVVRGALRARTLTWPALLTFAWALTYWQESMANVTGARFAYNADFYDLGDWTDHLPFVEMSGPGLPQPLGMETFVFVGMFPVFSWTIAAGLRALHRRTQWHPALVAGAVYAAVLVFEFLVEMRSIAQGVHSYPEVFGALSIRDGQVDQFPLYENWLLGLMWFLPGLLIFLVRDLRGRDLPRPGPRTVLAAAGALNIAFLLYNLVAFVWLPADTVAPMPPWLNP